MNTVLPLKYKTMGTLLNLLKKHMANEQWQAATSVIDALTEEFDSMDKTDHIVHNGFMRTTFEEPAHNLGDLTVTSTKPKTKSRTAT